MWSQFLLILTLAPNFFIHHVTPFPSFVNPNEKITNEILTADRKVNDLPVVEAKPIMEQITEMMESPDKKMQEEAEIALNSINDQIYDERNEFAQVVMNGVKFMVNLGASGTALRCENESVFRRIWNAFMEFLNNIFKFFGFIKDVKGAFSQHKGDLIYSLKRIEPFDVDDLRILIPALQDVLETISQVVKHKTEVLDSLKKRRNTVMAATVEDAMAQLKKDEEYRRLVEEYLEKKKTELKEKQEKALSSTTKDKEHHVK